MSALAAGQLISERYQLDRRIAVGGMGEVWEASDTRLGRSVAVKVLKADLSDDPEFLHRFRIEARTVASLDHSGIAAVHDYGEDDGAAGGGRTAYLVMELVRGEPLSTRIGRGPIPSDEALDILEQAARALQAAHERGFVHRDVKPGNILLRTDGVVKLTDFGIAKAADAVPVTRSGMVMGTAHYIAPEQASGEEAGPSGDVYSLGVVGYECLAGVRPFRAESAVAVAMMQVRDDPPPLPGELPERVRELIASVLVKDPEQRYADGAEFADAVAAVRRGHRPPPAGIPAPTGNAPGFSGDDEPPAAPRRHARTDDGDPDPARRDGGPSGPGIPAPADPPARSPRHGVDTGRPPGPAHPPPAGPGARPATGDPAARSGGMPLPGGPPARPRSGPLPAPPPGTPAHGRESQHPGPAGRAPAGPPPPGPQGPHAPGGRPAPLRPPVHRPNSDRVPEQHPSGPLDLTPKRSGRAKAWLAVFFVLLTVAAVLLAVMILRDAPPGTGRTGSLGPPAGTVALAAGREADRTGQTAVGRPLVAVPTHEGPEVLR
ncbi:Serine/threonine protein kinase [Pseudonocardia ammonioxydans]|uniref:non-specific serine/threonine protein kinase n=1 Tax=Pseudonocardia ammonioxydans TaxID=260086 RepID=A0A1I4WWF4_PSUAM|nr:serine/threonine-protein kinase [Pseudonocardia ammonioxydans]SFN17817.1 Serine/threonine protein kinase [Pseudonocardia ammonioxydans]